MKNFTKWNPTTGCTGVSIGCRNCPAELQSSKEYLQKGKKYSVKLNEEVLSIPSSTKDPQIYEVCHNSDLFQAGVPTEFILKVFKIMNDNPQHIFLVRTKRTNSLENINNKVQWTKNIWLGVSIDCEGAMYRLEVLKNIPAQFKFVAFDPLMGPIPNPDLKQIDWVMVKGEDNGLGNARALQMNWFEDIFEQCLLNDIPFCFSDWGSSKETPKGKLLCDSEYDNYPFEFIATLQCDYLLRS